MSIKEEIHVLLNKSGNFAGIRKSILQKYPELLQKILSFTSFLPEDTTISERLYCIQNEIAARPLCVKCNKPTKFGFIKKGIIGYRSYCSYRCSNSNNGAEYETKYCFCGKSVNRYGTKYADTCSKICAAEKKRLEKYTQEQYDLLLNKETLLHEHHDLKKSILQISHEYGIEKTTIGRYLKYHNIEVEIFNKSFLETQIIEYIRTLTNTEIQTNTRSILNCQELDIFLPEFKLAIEVNGVYFHGSEFAPAQENIKYHLKKTIACEELGIRLVHIFEHEWYEKNHQIKNLLKNILNKKLVSIGARRTKIISVNKNDERSFLNKNHLQGYCASNICYGLVYKNNIVQIMSFGKPRFSKKTNQVELIRFCTEEGYSISGGAQKLFRYYLQSHKIDRIISYCDRSKFTGRIYQILGFELDHYSKPGYIWIKSSNNKVLSRYVTQKHKLKFLLKDKFDSSLSESENMFRSNYCRLWDCGQKVFIYSSIYSLTN